MDDEFEQKITEILTLVEEHLQGGWQGPNRTHSVEDTLQRAMCDTEVQDYLQHRRTHLGARPRRL